MKPTTLSPGKFGLIILVLGLSIGLISWDYQQKTGNTPQSSTDTIPKKTKEKKVKDLDEALAELERADFQVDMEKMQADIARAMKEIDGEKIKLDIEKAMKDVDFAKIEAEVKASLAKVDWENVKKEIASAMKEVDLAKIEHEVQASLARVDWENMKKELEKVKEIDMKKLGEELKKLSAEMNELGPKLEVEMKKAKLELEKAKAELKEYKEFVDGLDNDGLISKKEGYSLEHKDGTLLINGKKAGEGVYNKYKSFLDKHPKFKLNTNNENDQLIEL